MLHCPTCLSSVREASQPSRECPQPPGETSKAEAEDLLAELSRLRVKVLENQLEQARLEERLVAHARSVSAEERMERSRQELEQSGWYYGDINWQDSAVLLQDTRHGTFLVRDSQDPSFLYTLSLQRTKEGPTSVRISFRDGKFSLDADPTIRRMMPEFDSIGALIVNYCRTKGRLSPANIVIRSPLYRQPPSLAHSARLAINKTLTAQSCYSYTQLHLPAKLVDYLRSYTLTI